jgi:hypothetical protein
MVPETSYGIWWAGDVIDGISFLIKRILMFRRWLRLCTAIKEELEAPREDQIHDCCIICRLPMSPEDSRILPCGHCYHQSCLLQWIGHRPECPLCPYNLVELLEPRRPTEGIWARVQRYFHGGRLVPEPDEEIPEDPEPKPTLEPDEPYGFDVLLESGVNQTIPKAEEEVCDEPAGEDALGDETGPPRDELRQRRGRLGRASKQAAQLHDDT